MTTDKSISIPIHVSTTFEVSDDLYPHSYSRKSTETRTECERVLGTLEQSFAVTYSSGMAAIYSCLVFYAPKRIYLFPNGYHGTMGAIELYRKQNPIPVLFLDPFRMDFNFQMADLVWIESPRNPKGEIVDISLFARECKKRKAHLVVDSTLAPPPIQFTLDLGADMAMHSCTKYLGGHSDLLGGVLLTRDAKVYHQLLQERLYLGNVMGNLEAWLLIRSMKTFNMRIMRQSQSATFLATFLASKSLPELAIVDRVWHASLTTNDGHDLAMKQGRGYPAVFSVDFSSVEAAKFIADHVSLFKHATSLGGVESLVEWRFRSDSTVSPTLCRFSIGIEDPEELKNDLLAALRQWKASPDMSHEQG